MMPVTPAQKKVSAQERRKEFMMPFLVCSKFEMAVQLQREVETYSLTSTGCTFVQVCIMIILNIEVPELGQTWPIPCHMLICYDTLSCKVRTNIGYLPVLTMLVLK